MTETNDLIERWCAVAGFPAYEIIIKADDEFRASLAPSVEKDPVTLACERARTALRNQNQDGDK